jgi:hypothetical protein
MVICTPKQSLLSDEYRGRFGRPSGFGAYVFGEMRFGEYSPLTGVYQKHLTKRGKKFNLHRDNWPTCPRTPAQVAWFTLFKNGMAAWKLLDIETKAEYNSRVYPPGLYGCNRFLQEYIKANR